MAGPGAPKTGGREKGTPNKLSSDVKAMVLAALDRAGGEDYLLEQATANPKAFMSLLARIIPAQVTGADGKDLIPEPAAIESRVLVLLIKAGLSETEARRAIEHDTATDIRRQWH